MDIAVVFGIIAAVLFGLAFVTKRRFGVLGAALILGYLLQQAWQLQLASWAATIGIPIDFPVSPTTTMSIAITILPSLLLLGGGPVYSKKLPRIMGSLQYALLAVLLCSGVLEGAVMTGLLRELGIVVTQYQQYVITAVLVLIIVDMLQLYGRMPTRTKSAKH